MLFSSKSPVAVLLVCAGFSTFSTHAETVADAIEKCAQETNSLQRLVCFDQIAKNIRTYEGADESVTRSLPVPTVRNTPIVAERRQQPVQESSDEVAEFGLKKDERDSYIEGDAMVAQVKSIQELPTRKIRVTLNDGQVWEQTTSELSGRPKAGDTVVVEKGVLGSFFMKKQDSKRRFRVKRIK